MTESEPVSVIPAQLAFLTIYNPSLGKTDETISEQIVFYSSQTTRSRSNANTPADDPAPSESKGDTNERLRQVGLAQGIVNFAKNFSGGYAVDNIETEKSRVVLDELEKDWWILASIDLTRLPSAGGNNTTSEPPTSRIEYSLREVYPPQTIVQQLRRAHSIFLLHHDISLDRLYNRLGRPSFCRILNRFWSRFIRTWIVLLNGNPAVDIFNGTKLALGGELGIGVGEEEWGSGEREVLEDFVSRTSGLVDLVVSRFGDESPKGNNSNSDIQPWLGTQQAPRPSDGVIFSGVGSISRKSLARVSQWMEWIYKYDGAAYGVDENPNSVRRTKQRKAKIQPATTESPSRSPHPKKTKTKPQTQGDTASPGIPPPLVVASSPPKSTAPKDGQETDDSMFGSEALMKYLTLGYGSAWKFPNLSTHDAAETKSIGETTKHAAHGDSQSDEDSGKFVIGFKDDLEEEISDEDSAEGTTSRVIYEQGEASNSRTLLRTLQVETVELASSGNNDEQSPTASYKKLQVLVYVHRPFMFTFLFDLRTPSLSLPSFYRSIHHQLGPLQKPLLSSTSPQNVYRRIQFADFDISQEKRASMVDNPIYDLIYDPSNLTVRSSIPNIPELGVSSPNYMSPFSTPEGHDKWSRIEALNVHHQFLSTYLDTRSRPLEMERTCKTSRGWWLVWVRIHEPEPNKQSSPPKEAILIRKASDPSAVSTRQSRGGSGVRFLRDLSGATMSNSMGAASNTSPSKLAEGLGLDAHKYIESLLSLNK
ncbi:hypothetical protein BGW36DRAFT_378105 [Talaromyces proteolyticus]|uniref:CCZ1/INTU/HSP4 first Longin domain-containing protein n=1 Tax=Talaromyces proteolyticus TaxID=1131652 RepID=A0AAD4KR30_9EURO|nr:uncharacterized protein BGW36DRAFT_378105 [Talaromyces proteolyticus]KAH8697168.1 hypothetical protein BGW36DRAFT_378105 [Talaromyces proteolyticus]